MNHPRTVLQLGAGALMGDAIRLLRSAGFRVFAADRNPEAPSFGLCTGHGVFEIRDTDAVTAYARAIGADLILAVNDAGVLSAAKASARLGLPGLSVDTARACVHKGLMRQCWQKAGLKQPPFHCSPQDGEIAAWAAKAGYPVILKPAWNWGSRGVSLVATEADLPWSVEFARRNQLTPDLIVETYVPGTEMTIEGLVQDGQPRLLAWSDKEAQPHERFRVAFALNYPARFPAEKLEEAKVLVGRAAVALGIVNGAIHAECMINVEGAHLIELGARGGGGHIFGRIVEAASGVCMPVALAEILLGETVDLRRTQDRGVCYKFFAPPRGVFRSASGADEARKIPGVVDFGFTLKPGTRTGAVAGDADRPGFVVSTGDTREDAIRAADRAIACMRYVVSVDGAA